MLHEQVACAHLRRGTLRSFAKQVATRELPRLLFRETFWQLPHGYTRLRVKKVRELARVAEAYFPSVRHGAKQAWTSGGAPCMLSQHHRARGGRDNDAVAVQVHANRVPGQQQQEARPGTMMDLAI